MKFHHAEADLFVPDSSPVEEAMARTTHLGIGAHPDDLEFMAYEGIAACYGEAKFGGVTVTAGGNPPKSGAYAHYDSARMAQCRLEEQKVAARLGQYAFQACLAYSSAEVRKPSEALHGDLQQILLATSPEVVYLHNPFDKHDTHVALFRRSLEALRSLPHPPARVWGCEVWRGLEWLCDRDKVALVTEAYPELAKQLCEAFVSQNEGGKRYDLAVPARWQANATFLDAHATDAASRLSWAVDLTPLVQDPGAEVEGYLRDTIQRVMDEQIARWRSAA